MSKRKWFAGHEKIVSGTYGRLYGADTYEVNILQTYGRV